MIPALQALFTGELAHYRDVLVPADDPRDAVPGAQLLEGPTLDGLMDAFRPGCTGSQRRALASEWSKYYFVRLLPPVVVAAVVLDWRVPLAMDSIDVVVDEAGYPQAFKLPGEGEPIQPDPANPFNRFTNLLDDNLTPLINALAAHAQVAPRVFWSNAGNYFEWILMRLAELGVDQDHLADGFAVMKPPRRPDGQRNPLYRPIRYVDTSNTQGDPYRWRQRRLCCIRYLLPEMALCENCPLLDQPIAE